MKNLYKKENIITYNIKIIIRKKKIKKNKKKKK